MATTTASGGVPSDDGAAAFMSATARGEHVRDTYHFPVGGGLCGLFQMFYCVSPWDVTDSKAPKLSPARIGVVCFNTVPMCIMAGVAAGLVRPESSSDATFPVVIFSVLAAGNGLLGLANIAQGATRRFHVAHALNAAGFFVTAAVCSIAAAIIANNGGE